jgi:hypothetical protein
MLYHCNCNDRKIYVKFGAALKSEAESNEKHGVWDPMLELTITSSFVHSRVYSNTFTMGNPIPESTLKSTLSPSQGLWIWPQMKEFDL